MFLGLLKKDFLLIKDLFLVWLLTETVLFIVGAAFFSYFDTFEMVIAFLYLAALFHIAVLPIAMMVLLNKEEKAGHYWLHGTAAVWQLLLSKLLISFAVTAASLILIDGFTLASFSVEFPKEIITNFDSRIPYLEGFLINGGILTSAIYFTLLGLFFWAVYHSLNAFPALKKFRWLIIVLIYLTMQVLMAGVLALRTTRKLLSSWAIPISESFHANLKGYRLLGLTLQSASEPVIFIWPLILPALFVVVLFLATCWLLSRKVEV